MSNLFPTRSGTAQGDASERTMADKVDAGGFRTVIRDNPDGSVTMLRTRGGALNYTTTPAPTGKPIEPVPKLRGFVAHKTDNGSGVSFDPTLWTSVSGIYNEPKIIDRKFGPVIKTYYVSELTTEHNAVAAGTTNWQDVWTLTAGSLRINNIAPTFLGNFTLPSFSGIPFFIPIDGTYGTLAENAGQVKRIFVVGREKVEAVTDGTMVEAPAVELCSKVARNEHRAMTCGPAIDRAENKALLSQLFYTGYSWDSIDSGWAMGVTEVAMLLTPPYLNQVDSHPAVGQATLIPQYQGPLSGSEHISKEFPPTPVGVIGVGEFGGAGPGTRFVVFPWRFLAMSVPTDSYVARTTAGSHWSCTSTTTDVVSGAVIDVVATGEVRHTNGVDQLAYEDFTRSNFPDTGQGSVVTDGGEYNPTTGNVAWVWDAIAGVHFVPRGYPSFPIRGQTVPGTGEFFADEKSGIFSVAANGEPLIEGAFYRIDRSGTTLSPLVYAGNPNTYYLDDPYAHIGELLGLGVFSRMLVEATYGGQAEFEAGATAAANARASGWVGGLCYDYSDNNSAPLQLYEAAMEDYTKNASTLNWTTRDYLLYDKAEQVYVYVLGTFSATAPNATLTIELVVKTRQTEARKLLYGTNFWYSELLPTKELETGVQYIPLPRLSTFFTPKYRHQGDFRGAAYTTMSEESGGATPVCLMNFVLTLQMFDYIGTQEQQDNLQKGVDEQFVPCNLLEMLYAYVFSSEYGQNDFSRYPVTNRSNFNTLYNNLFNVQHAIAFKDGVFVDWAASITGHNPSTTTGIYRT